jgi:putative ABC transport system permease protein
MREGWLFLRLALREISAGRGFAVSFTLTLAVGLVGLFAIEMLKGSFEASLEGKSRSVLGADLLVSSRRQLSEAELAGIGRLMPDGTLLRREASLLSMAAAPGGSRLVEVRAVDASFPFYATARLRDQGLVQAETPKDITRAAAAWLPPELAAQLGSAAGGSIKIGEVNYAVSDVIEDDPATASMNFNLAPRIYVGYQTLTATNLLQTGSRVSFRYLYKTPPGSDAAALARAVTKEFKTEDLRVRTHQGALEHLTRGVLYVGDYLGLVALTGLFLSAVGCIYLARSFLAGRLRAVAILISLGASHGTAFLVYLTQFLLLAVAGAAAAGAAAYALVRVAAGWAGPLVGADLRVTVSPADAGLGLAAGVAAVLLFCGPMLLGLRRVKPASLLRGGESVSAGGLAEAAGYLPGLAAFWLLAVWQSQSWRTGSVFMLIFLLSAALVTGAGTGGLKLLGRADLSRLGFNWRMALRFLTRQRGAALASFLAIALGALLVSLMPAMRQVLNAQLDPGENAALPALFMFDIQDEQAAPLNALLGEAGAEANFLSPMIRARITGVNGAPFANRAHRHRRGFDRDEEPDDRGRARSYNLSYRAGISPAERIVKGRPFSGAYREGAGLPELSLEQRFADRLGGGVGIGDTIDFDVQGVEISGRVVNLRAVRWTSFQPNFFIQFQPGVLEDAPKTYVAAVAGLAPAKKAALQARLVRELPNVSIIDVESTVRRGLELAGQIEGALAVMAWVTLFSGLAVLFAITRHQTGRRLIGMTLLKVLGASPRDVTAIAAIEFAALGFTASLTGVGLSFAGAAVLSEIVFESPWVFAPLVPALIVLLTTLLCCAMGLLASRKTLSTRPAALLNAD